MAVGAVLNEIKKQQKEEQESLKLYHSTQTVIH